MTQQMQIYRDANGVAHVDAGSRADMYRGLGRVHATDRGMQMLMMRILGQGRLSELLDNSDDSLAIDTFFRRMNWMHSADAVMPALSENTAACLTAYCNGINEAFSTASPWTLRLLGYRPEPWQPAHCLLMLRMMGYLTLSQSQAEIERLIVEMIQAGIDRERLENLFPGQLEALDMDLIKEVRLAERIVPPHVLWQLAAPRMMASNNWVVAGAKTASGKPIVANDPHLEVNRLPNIWQEVCMRTGDRWAVGASMPGIPGVLTGQTGDIAWGVTYAFMDNLDSWVERCRDGRYYRETDDTWHDFRLRRETILRKKKPPVEVVFYENDHGVLDGDPHQEGYVLATRWSGAETGEVTMEAVFRMWDVTTTEEAMDNAGRIESDWSFVFADRKGDIGFQMSGLLPMRAPGISGLIPLPGWKSEYDWQGYHSFRDLPRIFNPDSGFFTTTNQDLNHYGIAKPSNMPMGPYRAERIGALLAEGDRLTVADMRRMHYDVYSTQAERYMAILRPMLPDTPGGRILKEWDLCYDAGSRGAVLFEDFYAALYREVFGAGGMGTQVVDFLADETGMFIDFYLAFDQVLLAESSPWFNNRTRETVYRQVLERTLTDAPSTWGDKRKFMMRHLLFGGKLPRFLGFDRGPITGIGNRATIHQGQIYQSAGRETTFFPGVRLISDLAESVCHTNLAGGPSEKRFSRWYVSDLDNWRQGRYKTIGFSPDDLKHPFP